MQAAPPSVPRGRPGQDLFHRECIRNAVSSVAATFRHIAPERAVGAGFPTSMGPTASGKAGLPTRSGNREVAIPEGLEPPTSALGKPCSIRLSYGTVAAFLAAQGLGRKAGKRRTGRDFRIRGVGRRGGPEPACG